MLSLFLKRYLLISQAIGQLIQLILCGRGGIGRRYGLKRFNLSALVEMRDVELLKFGES